MINDRVISMLGLAERAGKISSGEFAVEKAVKEGRARLVVIASDVSDNTRKMFQNMCEYYRVPLEVYSDKKTLGHGIGKEMRASLAVLDQGFADAVRKKMNIGKEKVGE